eukprot:g4010.t1
MKAVPHGYVDTILIIPVGPFPEEEFQGFSLKKLVSWTAAFYQCNVAIGPALSLEQVKTEMREGLEGQLQLHCKTIMDELAKLSIGDKKLRKKVLVRVGVTLADLYPREEWNFVYGLAVASRGLGLFSFARYMRENGDDESEMLMSWSKSIAKVEKKTEEKLLDLVDSECIAKETTDTESTSSKEQASILFRCAKVLTHETGHLFGISHCTYYECLMAGCNHLEEFDKRPLVLCPIDLRKLQRSCKFDVVKRYKAMQILADQFGWTNTGEWLQQRIDFIEESNEEEHCESKIKESKSSSSSSSSGRKKKKKQIVTKRVNIKF